MDSAPPRRGLGQGLALLLGEPQTRAQGSLREIPIEQITPNPRQPRARIDEERFAELVESVRRDGIVQPILVRVIGQGWELIAGERRWRAAQAAGLTTVPALVREADDRTSLALALVENIVRADLDPVEQARGYARLQDEFALSHAEVATAVGRSRTAVVNATRLLGLPDDVLALLQRGELSEGHGRALLQIEGQGERREAARAVVAGGLSVRQTEALARTQGRAAPRRSPSAPDWFDAGLANDAVDGLYRTLGVAARVAPDRAGCRVELRLRSAAQ
ncbi:MAG TPA: ParB/RepB/Spo0J family partition protein, partial [Gaiellales bacterium]|nr:ParB/RepB/Spo0J family partition protein [Gaiellales bacterium]